MQTETQTKRSIFQGVTFQLLSIMILLSLVPLIVAIAVSANSFTRVSRSNAEEMNAKQVELVEKQYVSMIDQSMMAIQAVAADPSVVRYVKAQLGAPTQKEMVQFLVNVDEALGDGNVTVIVAPDGQQLARSKGDLINVADREYFKQAMNGVTYLSDVNISKTTGARSIMPAVPITDSLGYVVGIVFRSVNIDTLHDVLAATAEDGQELFITDRSGILIAHSQKELEPGETEDYSAARFYTNAQGDQIEGTYLDRVDGQSYLMSYRKEARTNWIVVVARNYTDTMRPITMIVLVMIGMAIIMGLVAIALALRSASKFTTPIKSINHVLGKLAEGEFETIDKGGNRKDEFGEMIRETNSVVNTLSEIVNSIKQSAEAVQNSASDVAETADQISQTTDDVSEAVQEIATGATQQADEIQHATESTSVISDNIQNVTSNASDLNTTAGNMNNNSKDSAAQLEKLQASSDEMGRAVDEISEKIGATSTAVTKISEKVAAINSIASQTNLLALNASIEAARAGEAGKGFAVVAEEIGKLADDSAKSADEIRQEMDILLKESQSAVETAKNVHEATEEQKAILQSTVDSIQSLIADIQTTVGGVGSITTASKACEDSKGVIVDAMSSLSAISEENAAAAQETSASMQELNATVNTLASTADGLKDIANALMEEMAFFKG